MIFKKIKIPDRNHEKEVNGVELWEVRWESRYDEYSTSTQPEIEVLSTEDDAKAFFEALNEAYKLLRYSGNPARVSMRKRS